MRGFTVTEKCHYLEIDPLVLAISPRIPAKSELFPDPTLPTMATNDPWGILKDKFLKVGLAPLSSQVNVASVTSTAFVTSPVIVGVKIQNLKVDFKTGGTWCWIGQ